MPARKYTEQQITDALAAYQRDGLAAAVAQTGIPKGTLSSWAKRRGVQTSATETLVQTAAAAVTNVANVLRRKAALAEGLVTVAEKGIDRTQEMVESPEALVKADAAMLRAVIGAWTRAIHDLQLLTGEATERPEHLDARSPMDRLVERLAEAAERQARAREVLDVASVEVPRPAGGSATG